jgi:peptide-methionine (R)-S-oxide reductase
MTFPIEKTDEQWREELSPDEFHVLRQAGTERAGTGKLLHEDRVGIYSCRACGQELFRSQAKFDSHCGWPSFYEPQEGDKVILREDKSLFMRRVEVLCSSCGSHLGHVFDDSPQTPTGDRYCMNSVSLAFQPLET